MGRNKPFLAGLLFVFLTMGFLGGCNRPDGSAGSGADVSAPPAQSSGEPSGAPSTAPSSGTEAAPEDKQDVSSIFVQKNTDGTDDGFEKLLSLMQSNGVSFYKQGNTENGLIGADDVVLLEINCQWAERGGTNTDLLKSVVEAILRHPDNFQGEIVIADNGQAQYGSAGKGGSLDWENTNSKDREQSVMDVVHFFEKQGVRISGVLWDEFTTNQVAEFETGDYKDGFVPNLRPNMVRG